jgi:NAD(P)H-flavin reductase
MSNYLKERQPGDRYRIMAPLGAFILREPIETDIAFISTGTGVAPFVGMTKHLIHNGLMDHEIYMFTGVRYVHELLYHDLFLEWERKYPNFHYVPNISRPETPDWKGRKGYVQVAVKEVVTDPGSTTAWICGLHEMVEQMRALCGQMGFRAVRFEKWD